MYNLLETAAEQERVLFSDDEVLFVPDFKWDFSRVTSMVSSSSPS
jgi:hypothetical protein